MTFPIIILNHRLRKIWKNIEQKSKEGYNEWYHSKYNSDKYFCPPWTKRLTRAEDFVLRRIHEKIYGSHWFIVDSLGWTQCNYIMYDDLKYRVL